MTTIYDISNYIINPEEKVIYAELRGLSTDEKPTIVGNKTIGNGSVFIEIDTGKLYFYDKENQQWKEV